jgi:2-polyprenyl-3-methyl-5-hydroxy-6-metoxy-1,4-benzoquinol methylase
MPTCPICRTDTDAMLRATRYHACPACATAFHTLHARSAHARRGDFSLASMSPHDREVNRQLAQWLVANAMGGRPGRVLDVGCGEPVLAQSLAALGCEAIGLDVDARIAEDENALGVPVIVGDVLALEHSQILGIGVGGRFRLVTLVHVFDRFADPAGALRKLRELVTDDGRVFLRLPDHGVAGSDRYMQRAHAEVAPLLHTLPGLLELCVRTADQFSIESTHMLDGAGQRDVVLRPLARKPFVLAGMIAKNEERDLPRCLRSIEAVVDGVILVDTGSTDRTLEVATTTIGKAAHVQTYTGASRQDEHGDWKLWDFGKARNVFVDEIDRRGADWVLWMDADDELLTPANLRRAFWWEQHEVYGVQIESAGQRWLHHRVWRANRGIRFAGRCHEYPTIGGHPTLALVDSVIRHDATPGIGESANARNLRILTEEFAETASPRVAFYLGSTHKDAGRWREAVAAYATRIAMGEAYRDEWLFAYLYKGRCERVAGEVDAAERTLLTAVSHERSWAEFWMELAYIAYDQRRWTQSLGYALQAAALPVPPTMLWRELDKYGDQPGRIASLCHEQLGDVATALVWAERARHAMSAPDAAWDERSARLQHAVGAARNR